MRDFVSLPLAENGGNLGVRPASVALIQEHPSGECLLVLAISGVPAYRVALSAERASEIVDTTWLVGDRTHINPNHIIAVTEHSDGSATYHLYGGLSARQKGVTLAMLNGVLAQARAQRTSSGKAA